MTRRLITVSAIAMLVACPAAAQSVRQFKNWLVACDNERACAAFGFEAQDDASGSYVRIDRAAAADAAPTVAVQASVDADVKDPRLRLSLRGGKTGVSGTPLPAPFGRATLSAEQADAFLAALRDARGLTVALLVGAAPTDEKVVSLDGAVAALRFMDAEQERAGGVTAIIADGPAPASAISQPPALPVVTALKIAPIADPLPAPPPGVRASDDCLSGTGGDAAYMAFRLDAERTLWAACDAWGPYNQDYKFFVVAQDRASLAAVSGYNRPGEKPRPDSAGVLVSPGLDEDGKTILSTAKDEGLGDCGVATRWVWDGQALRLIEQHAMPICRGVAIDDWPLVFKADVR